MNKSKEKIINLNLGKNDNENVDFGELLPQIFKHFSREIKLKLMGYFEALDDTLFDLAEKAESNQNQTLYFESMRDIRKKKDQMFVEFLKTIKSIFESYKNNNFDYFESEIDTRQTSNKLALSLVDEKELDETLAKINLINKSEMAYHKHIYAFKKRFSLLASGTKLKERQIPIGPYVIVNTYAKCMMDQNIDVNLKLIMFKLFERNVMGRLNQAYTCINTLLAKQGIIPEITYNIGRLNNSSQTKVAKQVSTQNNAHSKTQNNSLNNEETSSNTQQIDANYQIISQLFHHNETNQNSEHFHSNHVNHLPVSNINMDSMLNALSILQGEIQDNITTGGQLTNSPTDIKNSLIEQLHKLDSNTKNQQVVQKDEDTIDLVGMLFQFLVDDRDIPNTIQIILARLQIPYLKIALKDRTMFADKNHPARVLLDNLSLAAIGWTIETDKNNLFVSKINEIIQSILDTDNYNPDLFTSHSNNFNKFKLKLKKKADVIQKRTNEKTLGKDKINQAKERTAKLLVEKITNKQMPILVRDILFGEWSNVLVLMHLRHAENSKQYLEKIQFIDAIVDFSQQSPDTDCLKEKIKNILALYKTGLELVAFNAKELISKQDILGKCLYEIHNIDTPDNKDSIQLISSNKILNLEDVREQHEIVEYIQEIITPTEDTPLENIDDKFTATVKQLKVGNWLEFLIEDKNPINAKLSWISPITGQYLFVNSRGLKITDKSILAIAAGLRDKSVRVLKQVALFDRALSSIATSLKQDKVTKTSTT